MLLTVYLTKNVSHYVHIYKKYTYILFFLKAYEQVGQL
uniref:Uncharacterized protein n=1 Tax=Anguilla anguilla TaxID=7936 RepID=A0A0E9T108_ANGAN